MNREKEKKVRVTLNLWESTKHKLDEMTEMVKDQYGFASNVSVSNVADDILCKKFEEMKEGRERQ